MRPIYKVNNANNSNELKNSLGISKRDSHDLSSSSDLCKSPLSNDTEADVDLVHSSSNSCNFNHVDQLDHDLFKRITLKSRNSRLDNNQFNSMNSTTNLSSSIDSSLSPPSPLINAGTDATPKTTKLFLLDSPSSLTKENQATESINSNIDTNSLFSPSKLFQKGQEITSKPNVDDNFKCEKKKLSINAFDDVTNDYFYHHIGLSRRKNFKLTNSNNDSFTLNSENDDNKNDIKKHKEDIMPKENEENKVVNTTTTTTTTSITNDPIEPPSVIDTPSILSESKVEKVITTVTETKTSGAPKREETKITEVKTSYVPKRDEVKLVETKTTPTQLKEESVQKSSSIKEETSSTLNDTVLTSYTSSPYRSTIAPRLTLVSRRAQPVTVNTTPNAFGSNAISLRPAVLQNTAAYALKETRQKEKQQLSELNDRFASYVERVRYLEAQNKKLQIELDALRGKWGQESKQIEQMYKIELEEARNVMNDTAKHRDSLQLKLNRNEKDLVDIRRKYADLEVILSSDKSKISQLNEQISSNESEIGLLRRRLNDLQDEEKRYRNEAQRMLSEIQRVTFELENEMKQRLILENDKQSLEEELLFIKEIHNKELEEMKQLAIQESGFDPSLFFKSELSNAIRQIRDEYDALSQAQRSELEGWYRLKVTEIQRKNAQQLANGAETDGLNKDQAKRLKSQVNDSKRNICDLKAKNAELESRIRDLEEEIRREETESGSLLKSKESEIEILREDLGKMMTDYEDLMATKSDLEVEIRTYRKLLEGEENKDGLKQIVETIEHRARSLNNNTSGYTSDFQQQYQQLQQSKYTRSSAFSYQLKQNRTTAL